MLQKYFIAIVPPEPLLSEIQQIKKGISDSYRTKGALRSPGHITLHMPFSWEEEKEEKLVVALQSFQFNEQVQVSLSGFSCFEPRVVFIRVNEEEILFQLQAALVQHVKKQLQLFNQSDSLRGFHPHITVAFRDLKKTEFYKIWDEYKDKPFEASFMCEAVCLLKQRGERWVIYKTFRFV